MKKLDLLVIAGLLLSYFGPHLVHLVTGRILDGPTSSLARCCLFLVLVSLSLLVGRRLKPIEKETPQPENAQQSGQTPSARREGSLLILGDKPGKTRTQHRRENVFLIRFYLAATLLLWPFVMSFSGVLFAAVLLGTQVVIFGLSLWMTALSTSSRMFEDLQAPTSTKQL